MRGCRRDGAGVISTERPVAPVRHDVVEGVSDFPGNKVSDQKDSPEPAEIPDDPKHRGGPNRCRGAFDQHQRVNVAEFGMLLDERLSSRSRKGRESEGSSGVDFEQERNPAVAERAVAVVEQDGDVVR